VSSAKNGADLLTKTVLVCRPNLGPISQQIASVDSSLQQIPYDLPTQHLSDASRDLATFRLHLNLTLEVTALVVDAGLRAPSVYQA